MIIDKTLYLSDEELRLQKERFIKILSSVERDGITELIDYLEKTDFFVAPAAASHHSNFVGGLVYHSLFVFDILLDMNAQHQLGISEDTLAITTLLHDVCKINTYKKSEKFYKKTGDFKWTTYSGWDYEDNVCIGHGEASVIKLQQLIKLNLEECLMIRWHMGGYDVSRIQEKAFNSARDKFKSVSFLHIADMTASALEVGVDLKGE